MSSHSELSPLQTGLSADTGVSHSLPWPPKAYLSSEALDEAVEKWGSEDQEFYDNVVKFYQENNE